MLPPYSPQWHAFRDSVGTLRRRCDTVRAVGLFNEYVLSPSSRESYRRVVSEVGKWLRESGLLYFIPPSPPSGYCADASHPVAEGYAMLGREILASEPSARLVPRTAEKSAQRTNR